MFSGWDKGLTLRIRHARATVAQWPHLLVRFMLVIVYTSSGIGKLWMTATGSAGRGSRRSTGSSPTRWPGRSIPCAGWPSVRRSR
jgi:hypothetical protein